MQIGRKIYYDLATGNIIQDTGEREGDVIETTREQDFEVYKALAERVPTTVGVVELAYEQFKQDFEEKNGYKVDISGAAPALVFSYPDPSNPPPPPVYQKPLTEQVNDLKSAQADILFAMVTNNLM